MCATTLKRPNSAALFRGLRYEVRTLLVRVIRGIPTLLVLGFAVLSATPAVALIERRVERSFAAPLRAALKVDSFSGTVRITAQSDADSIRVVVIQAAAVETEAAMDARLAPLQLDMSLRDGTVEVSARYAKTIAWSWQNWPPVSLSYDIIVPMRCDVEVTTVAGGIVVGALEGSVVLANQSGSIFTGEIQGPLTARSLAGEIAVTAAQGPIEVSTRSGNISIGRAGGRTQVSSHGGYIEVQRAAGELVLRGNGSSAKVGFAPQMRKNADIELSGGELELVLETNSALTLDVRSSVFGKVEGRGELPLAVVAGGLGRSRLEATLNGGGPRITARVSGGNVLMRGVPPLAPIAVEPPTEVTVW